MYPKTPSSSTSGELIVEKTLLAVKLYQVIGVLGK
jgi:hypothetical protein